MAGDARILVILACLPLTQTFVVQECRLHGWSEFIPTATGQLVALSTELMTIELKPRAFGSSALHRVARGGAFVVSETMKVWFTLLHGERVMPSVRWVHV